MGDTKIPLQQLLNLTKDQSEAIENADSPSASNPFLTASAGGGGGASIFPAGFAGDGSDLAAVYTSGGSPYALNFTPAGKQFTSMEIQAGAQVHATTSGFSGPLAGQARLGVAGRLTIAGMLQGTAQGQPGGAVSGGTPASLGRRGSPEGSSGGGGGSGSGVNLATGPGGSGGSQFSNIVQGGAGGASVSVLGLPIAGLPGSPGWDHLDETSSVWWLGRHLMQSGLGGGAGGFGVDNNLGPFPPGGAGGFGGLTFLIECGELELLASGSILADGATGAAGTNGSNGAGGGGGGGSGGNIVIFTKSIVDSSGTLSAARGLGGPGGGGLGPFGQPGGAGAVGGFGRFIIVKI